MRWKIVGGDPEISVLGLTSRDKIMLTKNLIPFSKIGVMPSGRKIKRKTRLKP
jgi:hypothetical protein